MITLEPIGWVRSARSEAVDDDWDSVAARIELSADFPLEALDGILGEYHNLALLRDVLVHHRYVSPAETTRCLWVVSGYQLALRQQAHALGETIYKEKPRAFVRRIKQLWSGQAPGRGAQASPGRRAQASTA